VAGVAREHAEAAVEERAPSETASARDGSAPTVARLLALQRSIGNAATTRLLSRAAPAPRMIQRWDSPEHVVLGENAAGPSAPLIVLQAHDRDLPGRSAAPTTWPAAWPALWTSATAEQRRAMTSGLTYGEVVALSGDFYASWDALDTAPLREVIDLIPLIRGHATTTQLQQATAGRYLTLAATNVAHFSNVPIGQRNVDRWREMHTRAIAEAHAGRANTAWGINAAADHFLTDAFSGGHIRTPRAALVTSSIGNIESKILHDLDNEHGVEVRNARGDAPWIAYGDDMLGDPRNATNQALAEEAVRLSRADITAALSGGGAAPPASGTPTYPAERLVPTPVDPTHDRWSGRTPTYVAGPNGPVRAADDYTMTRDRVIASEGPGVVSGFFTDDDEVRDWVARQDLAAIGRQPVAEKLRMINTLIGGFFSVVTEGDIRAIEIILSSVTTEAEMETLRRALSPRAIDIGDMGYRTRLRVALVRHP
jgi:hypothetical protein